MWLGEQITERGLGNGISLIIFAGIAAGLPRAIGQTLEQVAHRRLFDPAGARHRRRWSSWSRRSSCSSSAALRKILVNYAKRQVGNKVYAGPELAPAAEAQHGRRDSADLRLVDHPVPGDAGAVVRQRREHDLAARPRRRRWRPGQPVHEILYAAAIIFFCFFYTALQYNPKETAENLKKSGAFIPGLPARRADGASTSRRSRCG